MRAQTSSELLGFGII